MSDTVVSVRMPKQLVLELKQLTINNHYLDLSEHIREVIRTKTFEKLKEINQKPQDSKPSIDKDKLIKELLEIVEGLKK